MSFTILERVLLFVLVLHWIWFFIYRIFARQSRNHERFLIGKEASLLYQCGCANFPHTHEWLIQVAHPGRLPQLRLHPSQLCPHCHANRALEEAAKSPPEAK